jgi:hypothetical protein
VAAATLLGSVTWNTNSGTKTVTATPTASDLIALILGHTGSTSAAAPTDDNTDGLGTYTLAQSNVYTTSGNFLAIYVRDALIGSATSTIFSHAPGATSGGGVAVIRITGMTKTGTLAIRSVGGQDNQTSGTPTVTLSNTALTGNPVIGAVMGNSNPLSITPPTSFTEQTDVGYTNPNGGLEVATRDSGHTSSTVAWGTSLSNDFASSAVELDASAAAHSLPPDLDRRVRRNSLLSRCSGILVPRLWLPAPGEALPAI